MSRPGELNTKIIREFRRTTARSAARSRGAGHAADLNRGPGRASSGLTPVMYLLDGGRYVVFASKAGAPTNPDWYHNLVAHPDASIEVGTERLGRRHVITGAERDEL